MLVTKGTGSGLFGVEDGQVGTVKAGEEEMWTPHVHLTSIGHREEVKRQLGVEPTY